MDSFVTIYFLFCSPKRIFVHFLCFCILLLSPVFVIADDNAPTYVAGGALGYSTFSFDKKLDEDIIFLTAEATFTAIYRRFNATLNLLSSVTGSPVSEEDETGDASRTDYDLLVGYQLNNDLIVFGGIKSGNTTIDFRNRDTNESATDRYKEVGIYLGTSYTFQLQRSAKLSLSIAYAYLDADNTFNKGEETNPDEPGFEFDDITGHTSGHSQGFSSVINWNMPITNNLVYQTKLKLNFYTQSIDYEGRTYDNINESFVVLSIGASYIF